MYIAANVPTIESGTATLGMKVAAEIGGLDPDLLEEDLGVLDRQHQPDLAPHRHRQHRRGIEGLVVGVGLQVHEAPSLSARAPEDVVLPVGCVVTVEPGVYIPGWSGTRVEDCVLMKEDSVEVLTQSPTDLVIQR